MQLYQMFDPWICVSSVFISQLLRYADYMFLLGLLCAAFPLVRSISDREITFTRHCVNGYETTEYDGKVVSNK